MKTRYEIIFSMIVLAIVSSFTVFASAQTVIQWNDSEYDFQGDSAMFTDNMTQIAILEAGKEYYVIQKVDFRDDNFAKNATFSVVVGYALQRGDTMLHPPRGENVTDADHQEFMKKGQKQNIEFSQESDIAKSFEFVADIDKPFYVKSPIIIEESGQYTGQYYKKLKSSPISSSSMGGLVVVDKFSKAVDENGICKNNDFRRIIKHDYTTLVCVDPSNVFELKERGWALN